jgi:hypothetical protein
MNCFPKWPRILLCFNCRAENAQPFTLANRAKKMVIAVRQWFSRPPNEHFKNMEIIEITCLNASFQESGTMFAKHITH